MDKINRLSNIKLSKYKDIIYYLEDTDDDDWYDFNCGGLYGFGFVSSFYEIRIYCSKYTYYKVLGWVQWRIKRYGKLNDTNG